MTCPNSYLHDIVKATKKLIYKPLKSLLAPQINSPVRPSPSYRSIFQETVKSHHSSNHKRGRTRPPSPLWRAWSLIFSSPLPAHMSCSETINYLAHSGSSSTITSPSLFPPSVGEIPPAQKQAPPSHLDVSQNLPTPRQ